MPNCFLTSDQEQLFFDLGIPKSTLTLHLVFCDNLELAIDKEQTWKQWGLLAWAIWAARLPATSSGQDIRWSFTIFASKRHVLFGNVARLSLIRRLNWPVAAMLSLPLSRCPKMWSRWPAARMGSSME